MAYTIGIKRRWIPGYRKVQVTGHDWQNWRFILNLSDGSQEHVPGFSLMTLKVYPDFWTHLQIERAKAPPREVQRQGATVAAAPILEEPVQEQGFIPDLPQHEIRTAPPPIEKSPLELEVERRAAERVRSIQAGINGP